MMAAFMLYCFRYVCLHISLILALILSNFLVHYVFVICSPTRDEQWLDVLNLSYNEALSLYGLRHLSSYVYHNVF